jgi:DNA polymerase III alpha subunit
MIHLHLRTEFSFRRAFGKVDDIIALLAESPALAITDTGTWGHVTFSKACKKAGKKAIFGVELMAVADARKRERVPGGQVVVLAKNDEGLRELYELVSLANSKECFYYVPRVDYRDLNGASDNVIILFGPGTQLQRASELRPFYLMMTPASAAWNRTAAAQKHFPCVAACDNHYPQTDDKAAYEILAQRDKVARTTPMHIMTEDELRLAIPEADDDCFLNTERIAAECDAHLPKAENVRVVAEKSMREQCFDGAEARGIKLTLAGADQDSGGSGIYATGLADPVYNARLESEIAMIHEKEFQDYFYLVGDIVRWAKTKMLVGPARGSSAGSLVCYLLGITDVDPLVHDLMFERFIDVTRVDLPDIDIDFQDTLRDTVVDYLRDVYGADRVGRIGTVARLKAKSCLGDVAKELGIPAWEIKDVQDAVIERSGGDARAQFCVADAFDTLEVGKALVTKYPALRIASKLEGHAQHHGKHAAGVIVTQLPVTTYCSTDNSGASQIDKKDAETLNLLKIDALGLRILSVLQDALDQIGKDRDWLVQYPLDDTAAFDILNAERYAGIFQFEGYALQSLCRQMKVQMFDDLQVIGALARPGPLHCGAATQFIARRIGTEAITHMHPLIAPITEGTYGIVIYQEQVMAITRVVGQMDWQDVSELRKAMSRSMGEEFFNTYWTKFQKGANAQGIGTSEARAIWDKVCTFGSWAFNKSHSVSYGLISYWCCVLKAHYPLEYAAACLRNEKDSEQGVRILRDLANEGFKYKAVDPERSGLEWGVVDGVLLGGLTNIKGIGAKKAQDIIIRRQGGRPLLPGQRKLLSEPRTPYDDIFEGDRRFGDYYKNPKAHGVVSGPVTHVCDIGEAGDYVFIAKIKDKNLRDLNEYGNLVKRGGRVMKTNPLFLNLTVEDDTGSVIVKINRWDYKKWGKPIIEKAKIGDWFMWKGVIKEDGWRMIQLDRWRALEESSALFKAPPPPKEPNPGEARAKEENAANESFKQDQIRDLREQLQRAEGGYQ